MKTTTKWILICALLCSATVGRADMFGVADTQMIVQLTKMLALVKKQLKELKEQKAIVDEIRKVQEIRDAAVDVVRNNALMDAIKDIKEIRDDAGDIVANPFAASQRELARVDDMLSDLERAAESEAERRRYGDHRRAIAAMQRIRAMEEAMREQMVSSATELGVKESANMTANATSTLALLALDDQRERERARMTTQENAHTMTRSLLDAGSVYSGLSKIDEPVR